MRSLQGNLWLRPWCFDLAIAQSIHQGRGVRDFPVMTKQPRLISYLWYDLFIMDLILGSFKPTTGQRITFKKLVTSMSCQMSPQYSHVTLVSRYPFWQPSVDRNMDVHEDIHYQVNTDCICLWHVASNAWSLQEYSQSERAYYCSHIMI